MARSAILMWKELIRSLVRGDDDPRPVRWWERSLLILAAPLLLAAGIGWLMRMVLSHITFRHRGYDKNIYRQLDRITTENNVIRDQMRANRRYLTLQELAAKDAERRGTVLTDMHRRLDWWTSDDVLASIPQECEYEKGTIFSEDVVISEARAKFAKDCFERYYNPTSGKAFLLRSQSFDGHELLDQWPTERRAMLGSSTYEKLNTEVYYLFRSHDRESKIPNAEPEVSAPVELDTAGKSSKPPIWGLSIIWSLLSYALFYVLPLLVSIWSFESFEWLSVLLLMLFVDLVFILPGIAYFQAGVMSNEFEQKPRPALKFLLTTLVIGCFLLFAVPLSAQYPWVWGTMAMHLLLLVVAWVCLRWFAISFHGQEKLEMIDGNKITPI